MGDDEKRDSKPEEPKKPRRPPPPTRKVGEPPGNLRKREQWFRKRTEG